MRFVDLIEWAKDNIYVNITFFYTIFLILIYFTIFFYFMFDQNITQNGNTGMPSRLKRFNLNWNKYGVQNKTDNYGMHQDGSTKGFLF